MALVVNYISYFSGHYFLNKFDKLYESYVVQMVFNNLKFFTGCLRVPPSLKVSSYIKTKEKLQIITAFISYELIHKKIY